MALNAEVVVNGVRVDIVESMGMHFVIKKEDLKYFKFHEENYMKFGDCSKICFIEKATEKPKGLVDVVLIDHWAIDKELNRP